jgi:hypothetical protein
METKNMRTCLQGIKRDPFVILIAHGEGDNEQFWTMPCGIAHDLKTTGSLPVCGLSRLRP